MFVRALGGEQALLGIGKLLDRQGDICTVEYFDAPFADGVLCTVPARQIEQITLPEQTRVYYFNSAVGAWEIGRLLDDHGSRQYVKFPNNVDRWLTVSEVFVRWARPIADPTLFLAARINETPRFADGRSDFVRSVMAQRAVTMGMSALVSSAVELEAHQIEVVRRVLQDPVQRYLLADEVGLGKTIEAGILIRQCVLDCGDDALILVVVPDALVPQWRSELEVKFFLGDCLDRLIHVLPLSEPDRIRPLLARVSMLVIDEAHHLAGNGAGSDGSLYADIATAASDIERLLLLSATPALHNERGFLEMLHLLDPGTYSLDDEAGLRRRIDSRQALAEIVAGLAPENVLYIDHPLAQLAELFADDQLLQEQVSALRTIADAIPNETDPELVEAIGQVRSHISEVYRLHRRIVRHRRRSIGGLTPDRSGAIRINYGCAATARLFEALERWRFEEATASYDAQTFIQRARTFAETLDRIEQYAGTGNGSIEIPLSKAHLIGDVDRFAAIACGLSGDEAFDARTSALIEVLKPLLKPKQKFVIFCSDSTTADSLVVTLSEHLNVIVDRHKPDDDDWLAFNSDPMRPILVCDRRAEEGLNLQGGQKIVVHYDLPFNPNRIEQRMGRVDRYGSGDAVRSIILVCRENQFEAAWVDYLDRALRIFDRSVASLQYLIEGATRDLRVSLFHEGVEAIIDLTRASQGDEGTIEREIKAIDQQDALDALGTPPSDALEALADIDDDWRNLERAASLWIETNLQFGRIATGGLHDGQATGIVPFCYRYLTRQPHTLIPLEVFYSCCAAAIDTSVAAQRARSVRTYPLTYSRRTALGKEGKAARSRLLRYGDPFVTGMWDITQLDDRGRSTALWRAFPGYQSEATADLFFRFDFIVELDLSAALAVLDATDRHSTSARAAIRRRGDMAMPPFFQTIWIDQSLEPVSDETVLAKLNLAYRPQASAQGGRDFNLNPKRWRNLRRVELPQLTDWQAICHSAREHGEAILRKLPAFINSLEQAQYGAAVVDHGRLGQLRARAERRLLATDQAEWEFERDLSIALSAGIRAPSIRVDAVIACFLSGDARATAIVDGRA